MCVVALKGDVCHYIQVNQCHHQFVLVTGGTNIGECNSYERYSFTISVSTKELNVVITVAGYFRGV